MTRKMTIQLSLKNRVYLLNAILLSITLLGAVIMIWYTFKTEKIFKSIIDKDIVVYQSAEALGTSLVNQKGYVSYYFLDQNPSWLEELNQYREIFEEHLKSVETLIEEEWEKKALVEIRSKYKNYVETKDKVIGLYKSGDHAKGTLLHKGVRKDFSEILEMCERFKTFHREKIAHVIEISRIESNRVRYVALLGVISVVCLSLLINFIFARHILLPIRRLAEEADKIGAGSSSSNEVTALEQSVQGLIKNAEKTHEELKQSRETLMQSEKMALLGKLAAGTAHSIRNPLTSVKMRLFSLYRANNLTDNQKEDFNVISEEITQINRILQNFLEFSRPPQLRTKKVSPSEVVDGALHLLAQRLKSYNVTTKLVRTHTLSRTMIDPEQLKEVLVNIIINACEEMDSGGKITIEEEEDFTGQQERVSIIRIIDNGPGITPDIVEEIFNPFFTTKETGTGLGLSIAFNIVNEHQGWLGVSSEAGEGTTFTITLPIKDI